MKIIDNTLTFLLALMIMVFIGWMLFWTVRLVMQQFDLVDTSIVAGLTFMGFIIIMSMLIFLGALKRLLKKSDKSIHPEKAIIYQQFIDVSYDRDLFFENLHVQENLVRSMTLWASDAVLKQFILLKNIASKPSTNTEIFSNQVENVILEMRKDLGQKNLGIDQGSINIMLMKVQLSDKQNN